MSWGMVAVAGATLVSGAMGSNAAEDAADASSAASGDMLAESRRQFDLVRSDSKVAREVGNDALLTLGFLLGVRQPPSAESITALEKELADAEAMKKASVKANSKIPDDYGGRSDRLRGATNNLSRTGGYGADYAGGVNTGGDDSRRPHAANIGAIDNNIASIKAKLAQAKKMQGIATQYSGGLGEFIKKQPGYEFGMQEGTRAIGNTLSASGSSQGGRALKELERYGQDYAGTKTDEHLGRLFTLAGFGPVGVNQSASAGQNLSNATQNAASMRAGGAADAAYAKAGIANNAIGTGLSLWSYNNALKTQPASNPGLLNTPQGSVPSTIGGIA